MAAFSMNDTGGGGFNKLLFRLPVDFSRRSERIIAGVQGWR
jgi:hypothetical protein